MPNTTGSRLPGTARDIPASVEAIDQPTMQARGRQTWVEAIESLTGVTAAVRPGAAGVMSSRGFVENGFGVLYDGIRVSSTTITTRIYDSFMFDRIEVLRGPASVLYGEGAVGGAINMVRKQPSPTVQPVETITAFNSQLGFRQAAGMGGPIGDRFSYRLDGVFNTFGGQVDDNRITYGNVSGALRWDITPQLSTTIDFDLMRTNIANAYWGTPLVAGAIDRRLRDVNYNNLPNNRYRDDVRWLRWTTTYETEAGIKLRNQLWSYQADRDWINTYRFAHIPAGGTCSFRGQSLVNNTGSDQVCRMTWENLAYDHSMVGDRIDATWSGMIGPLAAAAVLGAEFAHTRWDSPRSEVTSLQLVDPLSPPPTDFFSRGTTRNQNVRAVLGQSAVFGEGRIEVLPGVKLVGGFRSDWLDVDYNRQPGNQVYTAHYQPFSYRVGALWDVRADTTLYAQYATAVEPRFALFTLGITDVPFSLTQGRQVEGGIKHSFAGGRGEITAAVYRIEKTNIPSTDPSTGNTIQIGKQSAEGVEISASWRATDTLRFDANLAVLDARYDEFRNGAANFAGKLPPNVPLTVANLGVTWQASPRLTLGGWLNHRASITADDANTVRLPAATIIDVFASYRLAGNADLAFRVRNLTDEVYAAWATDANYVILGMPRTYEVSLRTRW